MEIVVHTKYIKGELSKEEVDRLWRAFLNDPDRYYRFITLLQLEALRRDFRFDTHTIKEAFSFWCEWNRGRGVKRRGELLKAPPIPLKIS